MKAIAAIVTMMALRVEAQECAGIVSLDSMPLPVCTGAIDVTVPDGGIATLGFLADPPQTNIDMGPAQLTVSGTATTSADDGVIFHSLGAMSHPGCGSCIPNDNWATLEVVGGKLRASIATCAFTGRDGGSAAGNSKAEVTHDTLINDGAPHTFTFTKADGVDATETGVCVTLTVDGVAADSVCNSQCSWLETDTMFFGGLPDDFNRDGQTTGGTFYANGGAFTGTCSDWSVDDQSTCESADCSTEQDDGTTADCVWTAFDATWDDDAITSAGNFDGTLENLQYSLGADGCDTSQPQDVVVYGAGANAACAAAPTAACSTADENIDIGCNFFTISGSARAGDGSEGLIFHALGITPDHPGCGQGDRQCIPGDNWVTLEVIDGKMRGSMATCAFMMGDTGGASLAEVTHDTAINDGERHTFSFSKGSQASEDAGGLGRNCISLNVDDGTAATSCNSQCSWIETDTFWIGGLPVDFDRDGQGTERTFFGGGGNAWNSTWDPAWDDSAVTSVGNFITADGGSLRDLQYSIGCPPDTTDADCVPNFSPPAPTTAPPAPDDDSSGAAQAGPAVAVMVLLAAAMF